MKLSLRMSIKNRVAIWYSMFIIAIIAATVLIVLVFANRTITDNTRERLTSSVEQAVGCIDLSGGNVEIDPSLDYNLYGSNIVLYNDDGLAISGLIPDDFPENIQFKDETLRTCEGERDFFVYDRLIQNTKTGNIWIRGVRSAEINDISPEYAYALRLSMMVFPVLFIIALIGGFIITNRAFAPLKEMTDTAESITRSGKLTRRIARGDAESKDEIIRAAGVFNNMLDKVESSFNNEKQFTNNASHELRTPTAVIMAQSEYALDNTDDPSEMESSLKIIHQESVKMDDIVSQLLMLARADNGRIKLRKENTDISLLAEEVSELWRGFAKEKNISIITDCDEGVYMKADPTFFSRIYSNLISNAIKYGKQNGNISVIVKTISGHPTVIIKDDGEGMTKETVEHMYERFYREDNTARADSLGLGMSITKWIVEQHNGRIECESTKDVGTDFTITF